MRGLIVILLVLLALLQYRLWVGDGSLAEEWRLTERVRAQEHENEVLRQRNWLLER